MPRPAACLLLLLSLMTNKDLDCVLRIPCCCPCAARVSVQQAVCVHLCVVRASIGRASPDKALLLQLALLYLRLVFASHRRRRRRSQLRPRQSQRRSSP